MSLQLPLIDIKFLYNKKKTQKILTQKTSFLFDFQNCFQKDTRNAWYEIKFHTGLRSHHFVFLFLNRVFFLFVLVVCSQCFC